MQFWNVTQAVLECTRCGFGMFGMSGFGKYIRQFWNVAAISFGKVFFRDPPEDREDRPGLASLGLAWPKAGRCGQVFVKTEGRYTFGTASQCAYV